MPLLSETSKPTSETLKLPHEPPRSEPESSTSEDESPTSKDERLTPKDETPTSKGETPTLKDNGNLKLPQLQQSQRRPRPALSLPRIRLMVYPKPGFGVDMHIPFTKPLRLFASLDSYFEATSTTRLGIELNRWPFVRMELVPTMTISLRPSPIRFSDLKFGVLGASFTPYNAGVTPDWCKPSSWREAWEIVRPFVRPVVELQHRYRLFGSVINSSQRRMLADLLDDSREKGAALPSNYARSRQELLRLLGRKDVPSLDPGNRLDDRPLNKQKLIEQFERMMRKPPPAPEARTH